MTCDGFEARLIAGDKPIDDSSLGAHVGSCLRCFRTATSMRDVPRLAALLRDSERAGTEGGAAFDPGAAFWEKFPGQVAAGWVSARAGHGHADGAAQVSLWERTARWLRRPVPAALTGAVCAMGVALLVMLPALRGSGERPGNATVAPEGVRTAADLPPEMGTTGPSGADDAVGELDVEGLATLRDGLSRALGPSEAEVGADPDVASDASYDPATVVEDLEMLDETGLLALRDRLGRI